MDPEFAVPLLRAHKSIQVGRVLQAGDSRAEIRGRFLIDTAISLPLGAHRGPSEGWWRRRAGHALVVQVEWKLQVLKPGRRGMLRTWRFQRLFGPLHETAAPPPPPRPLPLLLALYFLAL